MKISRLLLLLVTCHLSLVTAADLTVTAANVRASAGIKKSGTGTTGAGAITAGQLVYRGTDSLIAAADANGATPLYKVIGIAIHNSSPGQHIKYAIEDDAFIPGATLTAGSVYILSATAGGIAPVADAASGWYVSFMGVATSATAMKLKIVRSDVAKP